MRDHSELEDITREAIGATELMLVRPQTDIADLGWMMYAFRVILDIGQTTLKHWISLRGSTVDIY